jgi:oligopeptidase B
VAGALNLDPSAARAAVLDVPFLDVLRTMLDPDLLLTIKERPEWGDPLHDEARRAPRILCRAFAPRAAANAGPEAAAFRRGSAVSPTSFQRRAKTVPPKTTGAGGLQDDFVLFSL